ncbi:DUF3579 domain-containing protein [Castellaniella sp. S9]|uniref:DUF3579 domain-containing protein n=1 Tax=Castellaniella sp. S9 TaxID=2993652 RepID=UPI0022B5679B|nr:DUF3579 domain-containing protein [Castellaniella sp. S9]
MTDPVPQLIIHGTTLEGQRFRPSDWAERLAGVMSQFRPEGSAPNPLSYSPYVTPRVIDGVRCVVVDHRLRRIEPLAWKFVCDFAQSNHLRTTDMGAADAGEPTASPCPA